MKTLIILTTLLALTLHTQAAPTAKTPAWKPDPKLLATLGPPTPIGPYTIRLPQGYTITPTPIKAIAMHTTAYQIFGPHRPDTTVPFLIIYIGISDPGSHLHTPDDYLDHNNLLQAAPSLTLSPRTSGSTLTLSLTRQYFKYRFVPPSTKWMHGFQYATSDDTGYLLATAMDTEPYNDTTLPLLEAAALSLRKTPAPSPPLHPSNTP